MVKVQIVGEVFQMPLGNDVYFKVLQLEVIQLSYYGIIFPVAILRLDLSKKIKFLLFGSFVYYSEESRKILVIFLE